MDANTFETLYIGMHRNSSANMLMDLTIADYPYISDKKAKRNLHKSVYKIAYPDNFKKKVVKTEDLQLI